jgi:hypothetical protein
MRPLPTNSRKFAVRVLSKLVFAIGFLSDIASCKGARLASASQNSPFKQHVVNLFAEFHPAIGMLNVFICRDKFKHHHFHVAYSRQKPP